MKHVEEFEGKDLIINTDAEHEFYMELDQAARALDVTEKNIMYHLNQHAKELKKGVHWGSVRITDRQGKEREKRVLYKRGLIRIAMFVRSDPAMRFRQWLEDLVIDLDEGKKTIMSRKETEMQPLYAMRDMMDQLILQKEKQFELENCVDFIQEDFGERIGTLEETLEKQIIDDQQAYHIKEIIDDIAFALASLDGLSEPDRKHYFKAYGRFKYEFQLTKYSHLLKKDYDAAVSFLVNWRDKLRERVSG